MPTLGFNYLISLARAPETAEVGLALASAVQKAEELTLAICRRAFWDPRTPAARSGRQRQCLELLAGGAKAAELVDSRAHQ